ncbi:MAG: STAS domain-containing protein [Kiritimatiellae bacterium]|nr:STAS domain-containing protein [Kiritimatiellia bacterium]
MSEFIIPERLNATTAPEVEKKLLALIQRERPEKLICNFSNTVYISSAGLRIMLLVSKKMKAIGGEAILSEVPPDVYSVFKMAGFIHVLNVTPIGE